MSMKAAFSRAANMVGVHWPVLFRGWLYFMIAALSVLITEIQPYADSGVAPSLWQVLWFSSSAFLSGLVAIRAFYDGSAQRHEDYMQEQSTPKPPTVTP